jgi:hypothetical protein
VCARLESIWLYADLGHGTPYCRPQMDSLPQQYQSRCPFRSSKWNRSFRARKVGPEKVRYFRVPLLKLGQRTWFKHTRDDIDAAVLWFPATDEDIQKSDLRALPISRLPTDDKLNQFSIGDDVVSAGMLVEPRGTRRNYSVFKFGKISNIPGENLQTSCRTGQPIEIKAWLIAANLVPGNSGSPILYYHRLSEGSAVSFMMNIELLRLVLIGVQSSSAVSSDVAFMAPANCVFEIVQGVNIKDADLYRGKDRSPK